MVRGQRQIETCASACQQVERGEGRLDHQDVRALGGVELHLAQRLAAVGEIHLVAAPVAEGGGRAGGFAERAVERGRRLRGVGDDRGALMTRLVKALADRRHLAVHHAAGTDQVRARLCIADGRFGEERKGGVVVDVSVDEHTAMAMRRVRTQAGINPQAQAVAKLPANFSDGLAGGIMGKRALLLFGRHRKK